MLPLPLRCSQRCVGSCRRQRREFCFTLENDIFVRYQSFKDGAELHAAISNKDRRAGTSGARAAGG
jgi:DNA primase catalytic subunit